jgi:transcriptional regulator CtsR
MKRITGLVIGCFLAAASFAQNNTVTIKVNGNKNRQIILDGRTYSLDNLNANNNSITVTDLQLGQHTIQVLRSNRNKNNVTTTFTLRQGYDLNINVNGGGGIQVREKRIDNNTAMIHPAMTDADFSDLLNSVHKKWFNSSKVTAVTEAMQNTNYYFTTAQVSQLLQVVSGESNRLQLAKASYSHVVDPMNFTSIYSLLSNQSSRDELANYVNANYNSNNNTAATYRTPMSVTAFNNLVQDIQNQWQAGAKYNMISNAFNGSNYFTSAQARQLIQMIDADNSRLQLAKAVYRNITDAANFNTVYELLSTQESRNELAAYIRQYGGDVATSYSETYRTPMTDANFQLILDNIRRQWLPGSKMTVVSDAIANTSNYFSTVQVRQLVSFINSEANRLQLLKSAYANTTDKSNFTNLYDLLNSQSSKDELAGYINTYR